MVQGIIDVNYMIIAEEIKGEERSAYVLNYKLKIGGQWVYVDSVTSLKMDEDQALQELFEKAVARWGITKSTLELV